MISNKVKDGSLSIHQRLLIWEKNDSKRTLSFHLPEKTDYPFSRRFDAIPLSQPGHQRGVRILCHPHQVDLCFCRLDPPSHPPSNINAANSRRYPAVWE